MSEFYDYIGKKIMNNKNVGLYLAYSESCVNWEVSNFLEQDFNDYFKNSCKRIDRELRFDNGSKLLFLGQNISDEKIKGTNFKFLCFRNEEISLNGLIRFSMCIRDSYMWQLGDYTLIESKQ